MAPEEGIARAVRALVDVGDPFVLLARERVRSDPDRFERSVVQPLRRLFERGQAAGDIRRDIASLRLTESLIGLIVGVVMSTPRSARRTPSPRSPVSSSTARAHAVHGFNERTRVRRSRR